MTIWEKIFTAANIGYMARGAVMALVIAACALVIGVILGVLTAAAKISRNKLLSALANVYIEIIRGTPMLLQIWFLWLGLPWLVKVITGHGFLPNQYVVGVIAIGINSGAYMAELFRSGIQSIDRGQWEAADALGLSYLQKMKLVILPQAFKRVIPPLVSEFITLIKDSSLLSAIGAVELLMSARTLGTRFYSYILPFSLATAMYLLMTVTISFLARGLERRLAASD